MRLQNTITGDLGVDSEVFNFAVDTCENFAPYVSEYKSVADCKSNAEVIAILDSFIVNTKLAYDFFSATTYATNDERLSTVFEPLN